MRAPAGPIHSTLRAKTILRHQQSSTGHVVLYVRTHAALQLASCNKSTTAVEGGQSTIGPHEPWPKKKKKYNTYIYGSDMNENNFRRHYTSYMHGLEDRVKLCVACLGLIEY